MVHVCLYIFDSNKFVRGNYILYHVVAQLGAGFGVGFLHSEMFQFFNINYYITIYY